MCRSLPGPFVVLMEGRDMTSPLRSAGAVFAGFIPTASILKDPDKLYIAIGILGATVMPHNLYLHSSVVQTRSYDETPVGKREAVKFAFIDSTVALSFALFINAAILIVAAATFHRAGDAEQRRQQAKGVLDLCHAGLARAMERGRGDDQDRRVDE